MVAFNLRRVRRQCFRALHRLRRFQRIEKIKVRHFRVHDDEAVARQFHDEVRPVFAGRCLLGEIAMCAHARRLDDAPQRFLAPFAARLVRVQHQPELLRLLRQRRALLRQKFQLLFHLAERGGLRRAALLQIFLVGFELLLERLDQALDGLLPLRQIALGRLLKFAEALFRQPQKFRRGLFQRIRAQRLERLAQVRPAPFPARALRVAQDLFVKLLLLGSFFRRRLVCLRGGERVLVWESCSRVVASSVSRWSNCSRNSFSRRLSAGATACFREPSSQPMSRPNPPPTATPINK